MNRSRKESFKNNGVELKTRVRGCKRGSLLQKENALDTFKSATGEGIRRVGVTSAAELPGPETHGYFLLNASSWPVANFCNSNSLTVLCQIDGTWCVVIQIKKVFNSLLRISFQSADVRVKPTKQDPLQLVRRDRPRPSIGNGIDHALEGCIK